ncbi:uncharacterized protein LOC125570270 [Nematostella vectensis]|uniref:uncharacterized protein LOC125570270 n=1 Tax=Nematostella vectensis TaxID=45351 RepID=UPI0020772D29|nr:uncharacterized protein LOC125570270 [Nematostella vectensis]
MQGKWADESGKLLELKLEANFSDLTNFVEKKARVANTEFGRLVGAKPDDNKSLKPVAKYEHTPAVRSSFFATGGNGIPNDDGSKLQEVRTKVNHCTFCNGTHELVKCFKFRDKSFPGRKAFARSNKLCDNCLLPNHISRRCKTYRACLVSGCSEKHHSLLHPPTGQALQLPLQEHSSGSRAEEASPPPALVATGPSASSRLPNASGHHVSDDSSHPSYKTRIGLRIVPVIVSGKGSTEVQTYAFLDDGSDSTLCSDGLLQRLGITGTPTTFQLTTLNAEKTQRNGEEVQLQVRSLTGNETVHLDKVWSVARLPVSPRHIAVPEDLVEWPHLHDVDLHNIDNAEVTLLIGNDVPEVHWTYEERRGRRKQTYAARTILGWTVVGPLVQTNNDEEDFIFACEAETLTHQIRRMYDADFAESPSSGKSMSVEDKRALAIMESSACLVDGHYQLSLPWKYQPPCLPDNRVVAEKRLSYLKHRLERNPVLHQKYSKTVEEYIDLGHAERISEDSYPVWYLPHHPVFHAQKPDKCRVVFDCAARYRNTSLNDQLLQGPDLTNSLVGVLLRFRQEPIAVSADIEKMFHQVLVTPADTNALRFLWWPHGDLTKDLEVYKMVVHLFGAKSSPSCASFALRKTAEDNKADFPKQVSETARRNFYVDDCLKSVATQEEAKKLVLDLTTLLARGGFRLTKWMSNSREVVSSIPNDERAPSMKNRDLNLDGLPVDKALGMCWDVEQDTFFFRSLKEMNANTRRGILSVVSSLYDPLGIVAPPDSPC